MKSYIPYRYFLTSSFLDTLQSIDAGVDILEVVASITVAHEAVAVLEVVVLAEMVVLLLQKQPSFWRWPPIFVFLSSRDRNEHFIMFFKI